MNTVRTLSGLSCAAWLWFASVACNSSERSVTSAPPPENATASTAVETAQAEPKVTVALDKKAVKARRLEIEAEIAKLGPEHEWAGVYSSFHIDAGTRIALAPEAGYAVTNFGFGGKGTIACGRVRFVEGRLELEAEFPNSGGWSSPHTLIPVSWGDRRYLFFESGLLRFCNAVNSGREAEDASEGTMTRSRDAKVYGRPQLPAPYQAFILDKPLVTKIVSKLDKVHSHENGSSSPMILLDIGRKHGAFEKMRLYRTSYDGKIAIVETVNETTCEASCADGQYFADLPIGAEFSTRRSKP